MGDIGAGPEGQGAAESDTGAEQGDGAGVSPETFLVLLLLQDWLFPSSAAAVAHQPPQLRSGRGGAPLAPALQPPVVAFWTQRLQTVVVADAGAGVVAKVAAGAAASEVVMAVAAVVARVPPWMGGVNVSLEAKHCASTSSGWEASRR
jgi:hypothetical protein